MDNSKNILNLELFERFFLPCSFYGREQNIHYRKLRRKNIFQDIEPIFHFPNLGKLDVLLHIVTHKIYNIHLNEFFVL